jgi:hypothetical protein
VAAAPDAGRASCSDQDAGKPMAQPKRASTAPAGPPSLRCRSCLRRVMTSNRARHELIQLHKLPTIGVKVRTVRRLLGTTAPAIGPGTVPGTVPDLPGDGDAPPSPSPICPESPGDAAPSPGPGPGPARPRFVGDGDAPGPPSPIPIGGSAP